MSLPEHSQSPPANQPDEDHGEWSDAPATPVLPQRRSTTLRMVDDDSEPLRIESKIKPLKDAGSGLGEDEGVHRGVVRLQPERLTGFMPEQTVSYADLVHDEKLKLVKPGEIHEWGSDGKSRSAWWLYGVAAAVGVVLVIAVYWMTVISESTPDVNPIGMPKFSIDPRNDDPRDERIADLLGRKDEARALYGRFLSAGTPEEMLRLVRQSGDIGNLILSHHETRKNTPAPAVPEDAKWEVHTDLDPVYGVLSGYFADDSPFRAFFTLEQGRLVLDWKATTGYGTASFPMLAAGEGDGSEIRTWVEPSVYYSAGFPESEYRSFKLYRTIEDSAVWGYAKRGSKVEASLSRMFQKGLILDAKPKPKMLLLALRRNADGALPNQWLVADVLHTEWIVP